MFALKKKAERNGIGRWYLVILFIYWYTFCIYNKKTAQFSITVALWKYRNRPIGTHALKSCVYRYIKSTNINNSRFDFFFSSLFHLNASHRTFLHHSSLCSHARECSLSEVADSPLYEFVRRHCWNSSEIQ
jgi:hypothetical protein